VSSQDWMKHVAKKFLERRDIWGTGFEVLVPLCCENFSLMWHCLFYEIFFHYFLIVMYRSIGGPKLLMKKADPICVFARLDETRSKEILGKKSYMGYRF